MRTRARRSQFFASQNLSATLTNIALRFGYRLWVTLAEFRLGPCHPDNQGCTRACERSLLARLLTIELRLSRS